MHIFRAIFATLILATTLSAQAPSPAASIRHAAVRNFVLVVKADGSVVGWGQNSNGLAGTARPQGGTVGTPIALALPGKVQQVALGESSAYALLEDGTVVAWGENGAGQLGNGPLGADGEPGRYPKPSVAPVRVTGLGDVVQIAAGARHALALKRDGTVWAWGERDNGAIGDGAPKTLRSVNAIGAVKIRGLDGITQIATCWTHNLALRRDGKVMAWGSNNDGELGLGTQVRGWLPAEVPGLDRVTSIAVGGDNHGVSAAVREDGTLWMWGSNISGSMGNGMGPLSPDDPGGRTLSPTPVKGITRVKSIVIGGGHVAALLADGTLRMWGFDGYGQTGVGTSGGYHTTPVKVTALTNVAAVYLGTYHSFGAKADGSFWIWGMDFGGRGLLAKNQRVPVQLDLP